MFFQMVTTHRLRTSVDIAIAAFFCHWGMGGGVRGLLTVLGAWRYHISKFEHNTLAHIPRDQESC